MAEGVPTNNQRDEVFDFIPDFLLTCIHLCENMYFKQYFYRAMYDWLHYFCGEWEGWALVNWFNHTSWVTAVTPTDRPKSVRNSCVIKLFGGVFMLSRCFLDCSVGVGVFVTGLSQISSFFSYVIHWGYHCISSCPRMSCNIWERETQYCLMRSPYRP